MRQRLLLAGLLLSAVVAVTVSLSSAEEPKKARVAEEPKKTPVVEEPKKSPVVGGAAAEEIKKGPLAPGKNIPGAFHPFNVTARVIPPEELERKDEEEKDRAKKKALYTSKGKFHCLVTEYDLDPVVMLFARNLDDNEVFGKLLEQIDAACQKNRTARLRAFVVFLFDDLTNVVAQDDKRKAAVEKVEKVQAAHKLSNVVLTIAARDDLKKYELPDDVALTVVMYRNLRIQASRTVPRDSLDRMGSPAIKAVLADISDKLLPRR